MSLQERRLHAPAYEAINFTMLYEWGTGWVLRATGRRDGCEGWESQHYERMSSPELGDVVACTISEMLGL